MILVCEMNRMIFTHKPTWTEYKKKKNQIVYHKYVFPINNHLICKAYLLVFLEEIKFAHTFKFFFSLSHTVQYN